jgi:hypothetical protein
VAGLSPSVCLLKIIGRHNGIITDEINENYVVMKRVLLVLGAVFLTANVFGQAAHPVSYQAVIRNSNIDLLDFTSEPAELVATHYVGESYGGGLVFYVDEEGKHGLITATIDKITRKQQKSETYIITNHARDGITTGKFNTDRINAIKSAGVDDAQEFENYQVANLSDWYLPTRYDLIKLYRNRAVIGGYSDFAKGWKSTEVSSVNEWYRSFVTGGDFSNGKDDAVYIRVIREF